MKKVLAIVLAVVLLAMGLGVPAALASPGTWEMNPGTEVSVVGDTITLGVWGDVEGGSQPMAVHGATMALPPCDEVYVDFTYYLYTWDSYNAPGSPSPGGTGYWDSFSISVSQDKYWNLILSDPLNGDPLDIGYGPWGGVGFGDGTLETDSGTGSASMTADNTSTNYLNVVLDTLTLPEHNGSFPSYGEIEITKIELDGVPVEIDIKPWSDPNSINPKSNGVVPVAILSTDWLDVTQIDPASIDVVFGPGEAAPRHNINDPEVFADHTEDPWWDDVDEEWYTCNEDDLIDLALHFRQKDTELSHSNLEATLSGSFEIDGIIYNFTASDSVRVLVKGKP